MIQNLLVPLKHQPATCREQGCSFDIRSGCFLDDGLVNYVNGAVLVHVRGDGTRDQFAISCDRLDDVADDIWGKEVLPWLEQQHREPA